MTDTQGTIAHKTHYGWKTPEELREKWGVEPGQLWLIPARGGWHQLLVDDATKVANLDRLLDGRRIATVATDPPYFSGGLFASARQSGGQDDLPVVPPPSPSPDRRAARGTQSETSRSLRLLRDHRALCPHAGL